jgi:hypothetical protein
MKTGYVVLALVLVATLSGYVGLRIGRSQAETRIETMEAECAEARAAVEETASPARSSDESARQRFAQALLEGRARQGSVEGEQRPLDGGVVDQAAQAQLRQDADHLVDALLEKRTVTVDDGAAITSLLPQLSPEDRTAITDRIMRSLQTGELTIGQRDN